MKETIKRLEKYIEDDRLLRDNNELSDFDKFCIEHCSDIEKVIEAYKNEKERAEYLQRSCERKEEAMLEAEHENNCVGYSHIDYVINNLYNELAQYQTSMFPQDMETTMRIAKEMDKLKAQIEILEKIKEGEK